MSQSSFVVRRLSLISLGATLCALAACSKHDDATLSAIATPPVAAAAPAPAHVDSALPRDEEMRRFTAGLGAAPNALAGGEQSQEALVRRFIGALERRDTAAFAAMRITKPEFAYLYYPTNPIGKPPYDLSPELMYFQLEGNSAKGLGHALEERGGRPLHYVGSACGTTQPQGENVAHLNCTIRRVQAPGDTVTESLFGAILERHGRFKFISYGNKL